MSTPDGGPCGRRPAHADTGLRRQRSLAALAAGMAWAFAIGCASTPPLTLRGPASDGSLECAAAVLHAADFEVTTREDRVVGEVRVLAGDVGTTREFVQAERVEEGRSLEVTASAYRLAAATHQLPIGRQTASRVKPSAETVDMASTISARCSS